MPKPKRTASQSRWLKEHFDDRFVKEAHKRGLRSRASFKLEELQKKDRLIRPGLTVVDLGAAPGGWSEFAITWVGAKGRVIACDILPMRPLRGVEFLQGDFRENDVFIELYGRINGAKPSPEFVDEDDVVAVAAAADVDATTVATVANEAESHNERQAVLNRDNSAGAGAASAAGAPKAGAASAVGAAGAASAVGAADAASAVGAAGADVVLSDMAPNMSGNNAIDQPRAMYLTELALDMARRVLKVGGSFVVKVFTGEGSQEFLAELKKDFTTVRVRKPEASRDRSREVYMVATGFKGHALSGVAPSLDPTADL